MDIPRPIPKKVIKRLVRTVYSQADDLIEELTNGQSWQDSVYHFLFHRTAAEMIAYITAFQVSRVEFSRITGKSMPNRSFDLKDLDAYIENYPKPPCNPKLELMSLIGHCLNELTFLGIFYQKDKADIEYVVLPETVDQACIEVLMHTDRDDFLSGYAPRIRLEKKPLISEVNFQPISQALFSALRNTAYNWRYSNMEFFMLTDLYKQQQYELETYGYIKSDQHPLNENMVGEEGAINLDKIFKKAQQELPPDEVVSYFDAYGSWPMGYPPKKEDYNQEH